jgi:hypothetical protein
VSVSFDVISDLHLSTEDDFDWDGKATSLFCIVAGNISDDLRIVHRVLWHLSKLYHGIFYIGGELEFSDTSNVPGRTNDLTKICRHFGNITYLSHHVVVLNGVAVMGVTGRYGPSRLMEAEADCVYLSDTLKRLQLHNDVRRIVMVSNSVPSKDFYFGEETDIELPLTLCLENDTEKKVSHWVYGQHDKNTEVTIDQITYINNSAYGKEPYWPKRISISY